MFGWYFSTEDKKLRYDDNRIIELGTTHKVEFPFTNNDGETFNGLTLCRAGLHASKRLIDALEYAPGPILWRVKLSGEIVHGDDKSVATDRTYIGGGVDVSAELRRFARMCALDVIHLWNAPDDVIEYLKTGNEDLRAATWDAARDAAREKQNRRLTAMLSKKLKAKETER